MPCAITETLYREPGQRTTCEDCGYDFDDLTVSWDFQPLIRGARCCQPMRSCEFGDIVRDERETAAKAHEERLAELKKQWKQQNDHRRTKQG